MCVCVYLTRLSPPKKREAQSTSSSMATRVRSATWKRNAPEKLQTSCTLLKEKCDVVFKVCKYMSQAFITDPESFNSVLQQAEDLHIAVPAYCYLHSLRFSALHEAKLMRFDMLASCLLFSTRRMRILSDCAAPGPDYLKSFVSGIVESTACEFLARVSLQNVEEDDGVSDVTNQLVGRLRAFYHKVSTTTDIDEVRGGCKHVWAILTPTQASLGHRGRPTTNLELLT